jgi:serine protease Do
MRRNAVAWAALVVSSAALVSSHGLTRPLPAAPKVTAEGQKAAQALSEAYEAVADFVKPSVVQISVQRKAGALNPRRGNPRAPVPNAPRGMDPEELKELFKRFFGPEALPEGHPEPQQFGGPGGGNPGTGSGFVYDERGHILTNNHVVDGAGKIIVTFHDGTEAAAKVVGTDPQADVAVIKVENTSYRPLPVGQSGKLKVGELVMAVGSPFGLSHSVTTGIISATDRNTVGINEFESFLQTDAAINPGNSGGPLVNMSGQVVGINSAIVTGGRGSMVSGGNDGVGFAIPIDMASTIADNLIKFGKVRRSRVGIALEPLTPVLAKQLGLDANVKGVVVGDIVPGSPAEKAGLKPGDVITGFNGLTVASVPTFRLTVSASESGKDFALKYWRDGKERTTTIVPAPSEQVVFDQEKALAKDRDKEKEAEKKPEAEKAAIGDFGLEVQELTGELATQFGLKKDLKGLLVSGVKPGSPAEAAGLEPGAVITRMVKDQKVQGVTTVKAFEAAASKADEIAVYVESANRTGHFVTLSKVKKD